MRRRTLRYLRALPSLRRVLDLRGQHGHEQLFQHVFKPDAKVRPCVTFAAFIYQHDVDLRQTIHFVRDDLERTETTAFCRVAVPSSLDVRDPRRPRRSSPSSRPTSTA